jgi:ligand-binding sensor domain-containing protein
MSLHPGKPTPSAMIHSLVFAIAPCRKRQGRRLANLLFVGLFLLVTSPWVWANSSFDHRVGVRVYSSDDGLPQSHVNAIIQARDGYLWVGTFGGLARFDGTTFTLFHGRSRPGAGYAEGPASDRVTALLEDRDGRLWIGTEDAGLSVHDHAGFRQLPACAGSCQVNAMLQGGDGAIWIASNAGLLKLDPASGAVRWSEHSSPVGYVQLAMGRTGTLFVGGSDGLHWLDGNELRRIALPVGDHAVWLLKRDGDGLLVGTERELYRYVPAAQSWQPLAVAQPRAAAQGSNGRWWVAQATGHVLAQDGRGGWQEIPELSVPGVGNLMWDSEGDLWAGSGHNGLIKARTPLFGLVAEPRLGTAMAGRAIASDGRDGLWLGSACGGLYHWDVDGQAHAVPTQAVLGSTCIFSLLLDRQGVLWIGTANGQLGRLERGELTLVEAWPSKESVNIWQREDGAYLVATGGSVFVLDIDASGRITGRQRIDALQGMRINSVVKALKGGYWYVGDHGAWRLQDERVAERWTVDEGLSSRFARALYEDPAGTLWIGTYGGGLDRIRGGKIQNYDRNNSLFDDTVSCIQADERGRLWLAGNLGVTMLPSPQQAAGSIESVRFAERDGLIPAEINGGGSVACHRDGQGRLWFSLVSGFGVLDPAKVSALDAASPTPHIEYAAVGGRALNLAGPTLMLPPFSRNLEIRYTAVNLGRPQETLFRFRLVGVDRDWVDAGQNRSLLYATVPWGTHRLEVQARVIGGAWGAAPAVLTLVHPQPWYQRPWIWTLVTLLGLLVLVASGRQDGGGTSSVRRFRPPS